MKKFKINDKVSMHWTSGPDMGRDEIGLIIYSMIESYPGLMHRIITKMLK